jgi:hypothetical protein
MPSHTLDLLLLPGRYAVCRLSANEAPLSWPEGEFVSVTRTADELSVVCREDAVPGGVRCERGWRCLRVAGVLDFSLVGVLSSLLVPLAEGGVGVFCVSTFDTDYLLVKDADVDRAMLALLEAGHRVAGGA